MTTLEYYNSLRQKDLNEMYQLILWGHLVYVVVLLPILYFLGRLFSKNKKKVLYIAVGLTLVFNIGVHEKIKLKVTKNTRLPNPNLTKEQRYERIIGLCEKYSVNEIYDEDNFHRWQEASGLPPYSSKSDGYEKGVELKTSEERDEVLSSIGETYNPDKDGYYDYQKKSGFLLYWYNTKQVDECKKLNCFITGRRLYDLNSKKLIGDLKDLDVYEGLSYVAKGFAGVGSSHSPSCSQLKVGAFKKK